MVKWLLSKISTALRERRERKLLARLRQEKEGVFYLSGLAFYDPASDMRLVKQDEFEVAGVVREYDPVTRMATVDIGKRT